ncbi:hypothetical protein E2C01_016353 [Portunus trituberculatus]|uniref:Uncharacterized protein n=1 Tax=Portunus trituberculatus TaxID=210409 RepID=A0A5B7DQD2_PORTR|nr:hypothetical protein [Portunus trituberculatus]
MDFSILHDLSEPLVWNALFTPKMVLKSLPNQSTCHLCRHPTNPAHRRGSPTSVRKKSDAAVAVTEQHT